MSRPGFISGVIIAAVLALSGAIAYAGLSAIMGTDTALHMVIALLGGAYIVQLLRTSPERTGRIAVFAAWLITTGAMPLIAAGLGAALITQAVAISMVRGLYHHRSVLAALADLALSAMALSAAVWASAETGSFALSAWSFFLVQALHVFIPSRLPTGAERPSAQTEDPFDRAHRAAEAAIRRIANDSHNSRNPT
jgi:hypothetical protein